MECATSSQPTAENDIHDGQKDTGSDQDQKSSQASDLQPNEDRCIWKSFNEGTFFFQMILQVDPPLGTENYSRVFTVLERKDIEPDASQRSAIFFGDTEKSEKAQLYFDMLQPFDVAVNVGDVLQYQKRIYPTDCVDQSELQEPRWMVEIAVRSQEGKLLALMGGIPLASGGKMIFDKTVAPEFTLSWVDIGCPRSSPIDETDGGGLKHVAIKVQTADGKSEAEAMGGNPPTTFMIGNDTYIFAVQKAKVYVNGQGCGLSQWVIYKKGFFFKRDENSTQ